MASLVEAPLEIVLEFARAEATGDPHAFRFAPQSYIVRTPRGGFGSSELQWDHQLLGRLEAIRRPGQDPALLVEVGETLRRFLAPTGWELHEEQLSAALRQRRPVHITIRSAAAELFALPWELLTLRATGQSLGGLPGVLVHYEWPETATIPSPAGESGGRLLVAWSAAGGALPAAEHVEAIREAASLLASARRAVAICGGGPVIAGAAKERQAACRGQPSRIVERDADFIGGDFHRGCKAAVNIEIRDVRGFYSGVSGYSAHDFPDRRRTIEGCPFADEPFVVGVCRGMQIDALFVRNASGIGK